ncbi:MAG: hypothetical protein KJ050_01390 [Candidatus Omnitrophica bacterium]|nr:hypothetical protein [bacterium]MBV6482806.1 hypothetical protein [bacterium]MCE7907901.1 hypothetical protein [Candidatus Omnitrophica bacterium COP1]MCL4733560.1 hypothetical protein [Candidatus Omnitrophota bacterium]
MAMTRAFLFTVSLAAFLLAGSGDRAWPANLYGFWEGGLTPPVLLGRYPADAAQVVWNKADLNVMCVVQIMDGLGRRQAEEIQRFSALQPQVPVLLCAPDRDEGKWPAAYIKETWDRMRMTLPIYDLPPENRKDVYRGFDPQRIRVYPQLFLFDQQFKIRRIIEGFTPAERIIEILEEIRKEPLSMPPSPASLDSVSLLKNSSFQDWPEQSRTPSAWQVRDASNYNYVRVPLGGSGENLVAELHYSPRGRQVLFQRLADQPPLNGKKVRLSALVKSNCIGQAVVALGIPTPEKGAYRFAPDSPYIGRDGNQIPLRILGAIDFETGSDVWQARSVEFLVPERGKVFTIALYLNNTGDHGAAAMFDTIGLEILE